MKGLKTDKHASHSNSTRVIGCHHWIHAIECSCMCVCVYVCIRSIMYLVNTLWSQEIHSASKASRSITRTENVFEQCVKNNDNLTNKFCFSVQSDPRCS